MGGKAKTRFGLVADREPRELFSVKENSDGSLILFRKDLRAVKDINGVFCTVGEQHYSIHNSQKSNGTTITQKSKIERKIRSRVSFVKNTENHLLWPIFSANLGYRLPGKAALQARQNDEIFYLPNMSLNTSTLFYSVWVARPEMNFYYLPFPGTNYIFKNFKRFKLLVLYTYIWLPTASKQGSLFKNTSASLIDGAPEGLSQQQLPGVSSDIFGFRADFWKSIDWLKEKYVSDLLTDFTGIADSDFLFVVEMLSREHFMFPRNPS